MNRLTGLVVSVAIACTPAPAQDRPSLESLVPSDTAMVVLIEEMRRGPPHRSGRHGTIPRFGASWRRCASRWRSSASTR
jgi:hypothetical protein